MDLHAATKLANDPNIAVALAASQYLASNPFIAYRFSEPPTLEYTNLPTRLTSLCTTPEIFRNLLDALVAVSATRAPAGNESIACALRLDPDHPTRPAVELILSSHEPVRRGTVRHLRKIWKQMLVISAVPNKRNTERGAFLHLLVTFRYMVYIHTLHKLRGDFAMHMEVIDRWKGDNIADNGELSVHGCGDDARIRELLVETLLYLEHCRSAFARMREDDQVPKRLISKSEDVLAVIAAMELGSQVANKLLLNTVPLQKLSMRWLGCMLYQPSSQSWLILEQ
ncbi:hypothetical protein BJ912DRAFT_592582 [Pholiota molesta]|nr:hypothetical protein BJ912DRAFT_592582 [Pholiota molesta]